MQLESSFFPVKFKLSLPTAFSRSRRRIGWSDMLRVVGCNALICKIKIRLFSRFSGLSHRFFQKKIYLNVGSLRIILRLRHPLFPPARQTQNASSPAFRDQDVLYYFIGGFLSFAKIAFRISKVLNCGAGRRLPSAEIEIFTLDLTA